MSKVSLRTIYWFFFKLNKLQFGKCIDYSLFIFSGEHCKSENIFQNFVKTELHPLSLQDYMRYQFVINNETTFKNKDEKFKAKKSALLKKKLIAYQLHLVIQTVSLIQRPCHEIHFILF